MLANCFGVELLRTVSNSGKQKGSCCLVVPSSTNHEIRHFHVVVVQKRQRHVHVMHVQNRCFANLNLLLVHIGFIVA